VPGKTERDEIEQEAVPAAPEELAGEVNGAKAPAPAALDAVWADLRERLNAMAAADPAVAAEFSQPLAEEPEDELLKRAWA